MDNRDRFFNLLEGKEVERAPFFPDITTWYENSRKTVGEEEIFGPGVYIPDDHEFHSRDSRLPAELADLTFLDFYRKYDWGLPVHIYDWYRVEYQNGVVRKEERNGKKKHIEFQTPLGSISKTLKMGAEGSWVITDFFVEDISDLEIIKYIYKNRKVLADFSPVKKFHRETQGFGVCDLVIWRSPFGKLIHEFMGFEKVVYALHDEEDQKAVHDFLAFQTEQDLKIIREAASSPAEIIIISDHADETLISPRQYQKYCIPFYQQACEIMHAENKYVSTHLDGNIKNYLPIIKESHFDLLDGCTPAPMFNYTVEELAETADEDLHCYCGVPSTFFVQQLPTERIINYGIRIVDAFAKNVIVNIGDILPPSGDINQVIELGRAVKNYKK